MNDADKAYLADNTSVGGLLRWLNAECVRVTRADNDAKRARVFAEHANRVAEAWDFHREMMTAKPARPAAVPAPSPDVVCSGCGWVNVSLLNLGEPGAPRMMCQSCCKKVFDERTQLVLAVARVFPGESRAQTALKYIRQAEERALACNPNDAVDAASGSLKQI